MILFLKILLFITFTVRLTPEYQEQNTSFSDNFIAPLPLRSILLNSKYFQIRIYPRQKG